MVTMIFLFSLDNSDTKQQVNLDLWNETLKF